MACSEVGEDRSRGQKLRPTGAERVTSRESRGRQRQAGQVLQGCGISSRVHNRSKREVLKIPGTGFEKNLCE